MQKVIYLLLFLLSSFHSYSQEKKSNAGDKYKWLVFTQKASFQRNLGLFNVKVQIDTINNVYIAINASFPMIMAISFGKIKPIAPNKYTLSAKFNNQDIPSTVTYHRNNKIPLGTFQVILLNQNKDWNKWNDSGVCLRINNDTCKKNWIQIKDTMNIKSSNIKSIQIIGWQGNLSFSKHIIPSDTINQATIKYSDKFFYWWFVKTTTDTIVFIDKNHIKWHESYAQGWYHLKKADAKYVDKTSLQLQTGKGIYEELEKESKK